MTFLEQGDCFATSLREVLAAREEPQAGEIDDREWMLLSGQEIEWHNKARQAVLAWRLNHNTKEEGI